MEHKTIPPLGFDKIAENPRIMESDFINYINGVIENMKKPNEQKDSKHTLKYLLHAKTEFNKVDVFDQQGKFLFWVPPLRYKPDFTDVDVYALIKKTDAMAKRGAPTKAGAMVGGFVENHLSNVTIPKEDTEQWKMIFDRYGHSFLGKPDKELKVGDNETKSENLELGEDEEW